MISRHQANEDVRYTGVMHKRFIAIIAVAVLLVTGIGLALSRHTTAPRTIKQSAAQTTLARTSDAFNKSANSLTEPTSIWVVVNKARPLTPKNYAPTDLVVPEVPLRVPGNDSMQVRSIVADAMKPLFDAATAAGVPLMLSSGYRSYAYQTSLYAGYVQSNGQGQADTYSARPGYSEHQTGLAFDVEPMDKQCDVDQCFAALPAGKWVAAHAYEYGFILRYPQDKTAISGYTYEPWHLRYIGKPLALELHTKHVETLEEFFGLPAAPDYL
jgi:D-alanyl-D-alanine carboxypeptidase